MWKNFEEKLTEWAGKISRATVLSVIQHSFMLIFPFMMTGSIFVLIAGFLSAAWTGLLASTELDTILNTPVQYTTEFISIYPVFVVAYYYCAEKGNKKNAIVTGLIALFAFVILVPYQTVGESWDAVISIPFTYTGAKGMFIAFFVGFGMGALCTYANRKKWTIKMPDSVPPFVSNSFSSLIPAFLVAFVFIIIRYVFTFTPWGDVFTALYIPLQKPSSIVTSGPWGVAMIETISMTLWWLGIHGGAVTYQTKNILFAGIRLGDLAQYAAGQQMTSIVIGLFLMPGVLPLVFMCSAIGRSRKTKSVTRVAAVPAILGISEPTNFGLPTVLNPIMTVPTIITYPVSVFFTYFLNVVEWLPYCNGTQIHNCPYFILTFTQFGGFVGLFWWIVLLIICCLVYLPLVRALDKQYVKEESKATVLQSAQESIVDASNTGDTITITCAKPEKVIELFAGKEVADIAFEMISQRERGVTVKFDNTKNSKKETMGAPKKFIKSDTYFSGLMVQIK